MNEEVKLLRNLFNSIIQDANLQPVGAKLLTELALEEVTPALTKELGDISKNLPAGFGDLARLVRRTGEMPVYFAKIVALWYQSRGADADTVKPLLVKDCGLHYEREFLQLVNEVFLNLPDLQLDEDNLQKVRLMKQAHRLGYKYENEYRGCAQCTFAAACAVSGRENPELFRAANGFAAGMSLMGDGVCGGYSGGIMAMGLFAGRRLEFFDGDKEEKDRIAAMGQKLREKFIETYDTVICHGIHENIFGRAFHITRPEDKEAFEAAGAHTIDKCAAVVGAASAWVTEILWDQGFLIEEGKDCKI